MLLLLRSKYHIVTNGLEVQFMMKFLNKNFKVVLDQVKLIHFFLYLGWWFFDLLNCWMGKSLLQVCRHFNIRRDDTCPIWVFRPFLHVILFQLMPYILIRFGIGLNPDHIIMRVAYIDRSVFFILDKLLSYAENRHISPGRRDLQAGEEKVWLLLLICLYSLFLHVVLLLVDDK